MQCSKLLKPGHEAHFRPQPGEKIQRVQGALRQIECSPDGNRMLLTVDNRVVTFHLPDPKAIEFIHDGGGALELACGPQRPLWLTVEYVPSSVVERMSAGIVRRIEF